MSEQQRQQQSPQVGIAEALADLTEQTRTLVREEITYAQRETWDKVVGSAPAVGLLAGAGGLGCCRWLRGTARASGCSRPGSLRSPRL
jgi:hypothetical protein